jgi:hypothetical protein
MARQHEKLSLSYLDREWYTRSPPGLVGPRALDLMQTSVPCGGKLGLFRRCYSITEV